MISTALWKPREKTKEKLSCGSGKYLSSVDLKASTITVRQDRWILFLVVWVIESDSTNRQTMKDVHWEIKKVKDASPFVVKEFYFLTHYHTEFKKWINIVFKGFRKDLTIYPTQLRASNLKHTIKFGVKK